MICPACTGTGMESTDPEDASTCLDCNGSGVLDSSAGSASVTSAMKNPMTEEVTMSAAAPILCQRCEHGSRHGTPATHRVEWREISDAPNWANRVTLRCDDCTRALYAWLNVAHPDNYNGAAPGIPSGSVEKDEPVAA